MRWGPAKCFCKDDLYKLSFGNLKPTSIEEKLFGHIDFRGKTAVEYFSHFEHPSANRGMFMAMLHFMSTQKLRTPKGLNNIDTWSEGRKLNEEMKLQFMVMFQRLFVTNWTECVWSIADASQSSTKFIISDHPVTLYNKGCFPDSRFCEKGNDPGVALTGTHTIFPLCLDKTLILTNQSWVRNPYESPHAPRPNVWPFRTSIFNFNNILTGRLLTEEEVIEINYIIKKRAYRYIAAASKEWLYPENSVLTERWDELGGGYLLMPDPRSVSFGGETFMENKSGDFYSFDEYGRIPSQKGYSDSDRQESEWRTFLAFKGEFARVYGPKRRETSYEHGRKSPEKDSPEIHKEYLSYERFKPKN